MKQFMVFNKGAVYFVDAPTMFDAEQKAIAICDSSEEIIIREVKEVKFFRKNVKIAL
jgi:hypothetical protein